MIFAKIRKFFQSKINLSSKKTHGYSAIDNAKRFLDSAKKCEDSAPNVSYVLATTALEEVGKAILKKQKLLEGISERETPSWLSKHGDNHQKKLFWAIWTPMLGNQVITGKKMKGSHFKTVSALATAK